MRKIACITGKSGQDGSYLAELLLNKNYIVVAEIGEVQEMIIGGINI